METKTCSKCGETKALSEFYKRPRYRLGVYCHCKKCVYGKHRNWVQANREYLRQYQREYTATRRAAAREAVNQ